MRAIDLINHQNGEIIIVCETEQLFGLLKKTVRFSADREFPDGYWNWSKLPNKEIVPTSLSFQLDYWCKDLLKRKKTNLNHGYN